MSASGGTVRKMAKVVIKSKKPVKCSKKNYSKEGTGECQQEIKSERNPVSKNTDKYGG